MASANIDVVEVATQAIEAAGAIASGIQSLKILSLAKNYYNLYKNQRDFYYSTFQQGAETPLVNSIYGEAPYLTDYVGRAGRLFATSTGPFAGEVTDTAGWWQRHSNMYGVAMNPYILSLEEDTARLQSDWVNHMFRFEETWADLRNDTRWERRLMAHNVGIKQGTSVASALAGALDSYQGHIADFGSMLATYGNGFAKYAGYRRGLADTADDFITGTRFDSAGPEVWRRHEGDRVEVMLGENNARNN